MDQLAGIVVKVLLFSFIAGMFILVFTVSARGRKKEERIKQEHKQLSGIAAERGWTYATRAGGQIDQYCGVGPMPGKGSNLTAWHYTTGEFRGRPFKCFEHRYINPMASADAVDRKQPIIETVFVLTAPGSGPSLEILPPSRLDAVLDRRARMQLGVPEFDQKFRIVAKDGDLVQRALSGAVVPFLLSDPRAEKSPLQIRNNELFTWYTGTLSPQAVDEKLNFLCDVVDRIPAQAWAAA
ncbi:hypothetical protein SRB17_72580 [Streptomyces sp. RB17]|uniref:hypothetical protein n=1 Tax=Streptomyces sp. RB17 TaxID=2585197 RepID=UPI001297F588|nr:hypothetical protein [Streptomyces sp. RB17]MQY39236.1 hypothetical protein [Streptomyces sp. RB17]